MLETAPEPVVNTDPKAPANGSAPANAGVSQPQGTTPPAPAAVAEPGKQTPPAADDYKARYEKLTTESIPALQSQLSQSNNKVTELTAKVTELESAAIDPDEIAVERDQSWIGWLKDQKAKGHTIDSIVSYLETENTKHTSTRQQAQTERQATDRVIGMVKDYDAPFADFLTKFDADGVGKVNLETLPKLRAMFEQFGGKTPPPAAVAAVTTAEAGKEPPPAVGAGAATHSGEPVWKPGMSSRDLFSKVFKKG